MHSATVEINNNEIISEVTDEDGKLKSRLVITANGPSITVSENGDATEISD